MRRSTCSGCGALITWVSLQRGVIPHCTCTLPATYPAGKPAPPHAGSTLDTPGRELLSSHGPAVETTLNTSNARQGPGVA